MTDRNEDLPWEANFVENMVRRRKVLGMSQTALAKELADLGLPFHQPTVQRIEAGERPIRINEAAAIIQVLRMYPTLSRPGLDSAVQSRNGEQAARELLSSTRWAAAQYGQFIEVRDEWLGKLEAVDSLLSSAIKRADEMSVEAEQKPEVIENSAYFLAFIRRLRRELEAVTGGLDGEHPEAS